MSRTKYQLEAPEAVTESVVEGHPYYPDEDGMVETFLEAHRDVLVRHGYVQKAEIAIFNPHVARRGPIEVEELGRSGLTAALIERGVSFPLDASRGELGEIALSWNRHSEQGRRKARQDAVGGETAAPAAQPAYEVAEAPKEELSPEDRAEFTLLAALGVPVAEAIKLSPATRKAILASKAAEQVGMELPEPDPSPVEAAVAPSAPQPAPTARTPAQLARAKNAGGKKAAPSEAAGGKPDFKAMSYTPLQTWIAQNGGTVSNIAKDKLILKAEELWATRGVDREAI